MKRFRGRKFFLVALVVAGLGLAALPVAYERMVTAQLAHDLDAQHGRLGWTVLWRSADAQPGEGIALLRTFYVRFLFPWFHEFTPWKERQFTHKTTTPHRPWHYAVCVISEGREVTYYWSMRQHQWIAAWNNTTIQFPAEVRCEYASRLRSIKRRGGLNWTSNRADEI